MKVLIIASNWFPVLPNPQGGIESVLYHTCRLLAKEHEVFLFAPADSQLDYEGVTILPWQDPEGNPINSAVWHKDNNLDISRSIGRWTISLQLPKLIEEYGIEIVLNHCPTSSSTNRLYDIDSVPIVQFLHSNPSYGISSKSHMDLCKRLNEKPGNGTLAVSKFVENWTLNTHGENSVTGHFYMPIMWEKPVLNTDRKDAGAIITYATPEKMMEIGMEATLKAGKNLTVVTEEPKTVPGWIKYYEDWVKPMLEDENCESLTRLPQKEVYELLSKRNFLVESDAFAGLSMVAFEALSMGTPVIAACSGGASGVAELVSMIEPEPKIVDFYRKRHTTRVAMMQELIEGFEVTNEYRQALIDRTWELFNHEKRLQDYNEMMQNAVNEFKQS